MTFSDKLKRAVKWLGTFLILVNIPFGFYHMLRGIVVHNDWQSTAGMYEVLMGTYMYLWLVEKEVV